MADHPEFRELQDFEGTKVIAKAYSLANENKLIPSGKIKEILGNHAALFFEEASNSLDHALLGQEAIESMDQNRS